MRAWALVLTGCGRIGFESPPVAPVEDAPLDTTADAAACFTLQDDFEDPMLDPQWSPLAFGGGAQPIPASGALVLDVVAAQSVSAVTSAMIDLREAITTMTVRDFAFASKTQAYLELNLPATVRGFSILAVDPDLMVARIADNGVEDNMFITVTPTSAFRMRVATRPVTGGTEVVWSYAPSETAAFEVIRTETVTDALDQTSIGLFYQTYQPSTGDPAPIQIDTFRSETPCP